MTSIQRININVLEMKYIHILLILVTACNTQNKKETGNRTLYDFEILYRYQGEENYGDDRFRNKLSSDTLYFIVESNFNNDYLVISTKEKDIFKGKVDTEPSSGVANGINVGEIENINNISIAINEGPVINFELIKKENNIIGIRKQENKVSIVFYKKVPVFD